MRVLPGLAAVLFVVACGQDASDTPVTQTEAPPHGLEPPVATNAESPAAYPLDLFDEGAEGTVILRLFADERGAVLAESTQIAEGSGIPGLDSAALASVARMTFAPARRDGQPVATWFLQPVHFRLPERTPDGVRP